MSTAPTLTQTRFAGGVWEGILKGADGSVPTVTAVHQDRSLEGVEVQALPTGGGYAVRVPMPPALIGEGVHTVLIQADGVTLAHVTIVAGAPAEDDLRAEIGLLRAELELLKRAFRRHCAETSGPGQDS